MAREYKNQNPKEDTNEHSGNIDGLGFNGDKHKVVITKDIVKRLEDAIKNDYWDYFATDGFFLGSTISRRTRFSRTNHTHWTTS